MPFVFRKIRRAKWLTNARPMWLAEEDLQADALGDLRTSDNELSVYIIDDERSNLERVAAAVAATADTTANLDYMLIDIRELANIEIKTASKPGETPDSMVNTAHLDLIELSASKLLLFANTLYAKGENGRIQEKIITRLIIQNIHSGNFARAKVNLKKSTNFWEEVDKLP